jgi:hypothetical protein
MSANVSHIAGRLGVITDRLEGVRRAGNGYAARCPAHKDRSASLSLAEGNNGTVLLHCFAGCEPASVLAAIGLTLADLFPERLKPQSAEERREFARAAREAQWAAALPVLDFESRVVLAAVEKQSTHGLDDTDRARLELAVQRIEDARLILAPSRERWRPRVD